MKSALVLTIFGVILAGCMDGPADPTGFNLAEPEHEYELDTWGFNSEVYEVIPRLNPNKGCIMIMLDNGRAMGLQCFDLPVSDVPVVE